VLNKLKSSRPHSVVPSIKQPATLIIVSVLRFLSAVREPVELSQPPPFLLGLHLVASEFLLPDYRHPIFAVLCAAARGRGAGRYCRSLDPGAHGSVRSAAFLATDCVLDQGLLALVRNPTGLDVPNFRTYKAWIQRKRATI